MKKEYNNYKYSDITDKILKEACYVYKILGGGFLEKIYENALFKRLKDKGVIVIQQNPINVIFEGEVMGIYYADLFVEDKIIVELKACESLVKVFEVQLVNYLKATGNEVGLLINFGPKLEIKRKVNNVSHIISESSVLNHL